METFWFLLAILMTFVSSLKEIAIKSNLKNIDSNTLIFILSGLSIIFWFPFIIYEGFPELSLKFWWVFFLSGVLFYIGKLFNFKAMQAEEISYIAPLKWLVSLWVLILWIFILKEIPPITWIIWAILVLFWTYLLNLQKYHTKFFEPIIHLFKNKWAQFYLITVVCYSFTVVFDKIWVLESTPIFWIFMMNIFLFVMSFNKFKKKLPETKNILIEKYKFISLAFWLYALSHITQMTAIQYIFASYVSIIKTAWMLFAIILWWLFFKENNILRKMWIWVIIVVWVILMYLAK